MHSTVILQQLKDEYSVDVDSLIDDVKRYLPDLRETKLRKAFAFSALAHEGQLRKSGHPYIVHPYETARILSTLHVDEDTLVAALLHDVPEDTQKTIEEIESKFGKRIAFLVEGITKLSKVHYRHEMANRQVESLKKLFIHTAKDPRIILIKLADRLHNMRTLNSINKPEKISRISRETLEIFVPIANLLGIEGLKAEMEDLCFKHLLPEDYQILADRLSAGKKKNEKIMETTIEMIKKELSDKRITCKVYGRMKNIYHIYKRTAGDIGKLTAYDNMIALRVILKNKEDCYRALGIIHGVFRPKPGTFRDYISLPKKNGYQSLHTTVFGIKGVTTEFQVRSGQMHIEAEYGIAAQYFEKSNKTPHLQEDGRANWACKIIQMQKMEENSVETDFMEKLKDDILHDRIFVFTPKGKTVDLPKDATCVDFAYEIHTEVGNRAIKGEVNGQIVPVTTRLNNNDTVNIITSDMPKGPSRQWLAFVKTTTAKSRILDYFRRVSKEEKSLTGRNLLQKELDWAGLGMINDIPPKKLKLFCKKIKDCATIDDVLQKIGEGSLSPLDFINGLYPQKDVPTNRTMLLLERRLFHTDSSKKYTMVTLKIISRDAIGQMRKILREIAGHNLNIVYAKGSLSFWTGEMITNVTICVENYSQISQVCEAIEHVEGVRNVARRFFRKKVLFGTVVALTFILWASHPYFLHYISTHLARESHPVLSGILLYAGTFMLIMMVLLLKRLTQRSFPELRETNTFWNITFLLIAFAVITLIAEIYFFELSLNWLILLGLVLLILAYLTAEYRNFMKKT